MTTSNLINVSIIPNICKIIDFLFLIVGLIALSFTAIFLKFSVSEISANAATVFNRLWIATIIFSLWNRSKMGDLGLHFHSKFSQV